MSSKSVKTMESEKNTDHKFTLTELTETGELEIQKQATDKSSAKAVRFPEKISEQYKLPPEEFKEVQDAIEAYQSEEREVVVYANSIECKVGYDSARSCEFVFTRG